MPAVETVNGPIDVEELGFTLIHEHFRTTDEATRFTGIPVLCVEVLSSNRATDLVVKTTRYAALGVDHYWVVDADAVTLTSFVRDAGAYRKDRTISDTAEELNFGIGSVRIDLAALVR